MHVHISNTFCMNVAREFDDVSAIVMHFVRSYNEGDHGDSGMVYK